MREKRLEDIKKHWELRGQEFSQNGETTPTTRDPYLGALEEENILAFLEAGTRVLDVGCGDAVHMVKYAERVSGIVGIDIAESIANLARRRTAVAGIGNATFIVGSVLDARNLFGDTRFDHIISQRCLINLPGWEYQSNAISQMHSLLTPAGLLLLTEGFQDELDNLNRTRAAVGLEAIRVVSYNTFLRREEFERYIGKLFRVVEVRHYGAYLFLSRVLHPLAVAPEQPKHNAKLNEAARTVSRLALLSGCLEEVSYNRFYALRKI